jgi:hypothetical protein
MSYLKVQSLHKKGQFRAKQKDQTAKQVDGTSVDVPSPLDRCLQRFFHQRKREIAFLLDHHSGCCACGFDIHLAKIPTVDRIAQLMTSANNNNNESRLFKALQDHHVTCKVEDCDQYVAVLCARVIWYWTARCCTSACSVLWTNGKQNMPRTHFVFCWNCILFLQSLL